MILKKGVIGKKSFHAKWTFSIALLEVCGPHSSISSFRQIVLMQRS